jgi:hypothetical protein
MVAVRFSQAADLSAADLSPELDLVGVVDYARLGQNP